MIPDRKTLKKVILSSDVYSVCLQHALTTEKEEIMGLLIGEVDEAQQYSFITACVILHRSDKHPDRVEISPEQLCTASNYAEELANKLNIPLRVVGWYHSHPHITVWPSKVDLGTQLMYQTMDPLFVGFIFSVYQTESESDNVIQMIGFQAEEEPNSEYVKREVEVVIKRDMLNIYNLKNIADLSNILTQEENQLHDKVKEDDRYQDELANLHNEAFKTVALVHIVSKVAKPLCDDLEARRQLLKLKIKTLEKINKLL